MTLVVPCSLVPWLVWHMWIIRPAIRKKELFGPRWLSRVTVDAMAWIATNVLSCPMDINLEDAQKRGLLSRQIMIGFHPHGTFCGVALFHMGAVWQNLSIATRRWYVCIADVLFRIPGLGEYLTLNNCRNADKATMEELVADGHVIAVQPGGIYEQVRTDPKQEAAYFPKNLGFIRLALRHGVPLVPLYVFGENQLFQQNAVTRAINKFLHNTFGAGTFFSVGRGGIPWLVPYVVDTHVRFGDLIDVGDAVSEPSDAQVKEIFDKYTAALRKLFDEHASTCLHPDVAKNGLKIVWRGDPAHASNKRL